jgi:hypothetical protein
VTAMDTSEYIKVLIDVIVAAVITTVLFYVARRTRKEQRFVGYKERPKDEKYIGFVLLAAGIILIILPVIELIILLNGNYYSSVPFGLTALQMTTGNQTTDVLSAQQLGLVFGISFWLLIFGCGGRKLVTLGMDMLKGREVKIIRKIDA